MESDPIFISYMKSTVAVTIIAIVLLGCDPRDGDITVYPVVCDKNIVKESCQGTWKTLKPTTYQVFAAQQLVVGSTPAFNKVSKLSRCMVSDFKNWECDGGIYEFMSDEGVEYVAASLRMTKGELATVNALD